jgi:DNA polymerase III alpha subunit (gram-positive type)
MAPEASTAEDDGVMSSHSCPSCRAGELITISMAAAERDLSFTTCHMCEAKWWYQDGELVPLASVIDLVSK